MTHWMHRLAQHYESLRQRSPEAQLLIVFDIDGTLLDTRPAREHILHAYDAEHGTAYFAASRPDAAAGLDWPELVARSAAPAPVRDDVLTELRRRWNAPDTALASHRPFRGVLEVIRWFQLQPRTGVAVNTGRPESLRLETLRVLNQLGEEYRVRFHSERLFMRADGQPDVLAAKREGIRAMRRQGYRIFAVVDNEPENLRAVGPLDHDGELLRIDAAAVHRSRRPGGRPEADFDLHQLLTGPRLPRHVQLVWQGIRGEGELQRFLTSSIRWGETRLTGFRNGAPVVGEGHLALDRVLAAMLQRGRRCKLDIPLAAELDRLILWLKSSGFPPEALWLAPEDASGPEPFRRLSQALPGSLRQYRIGRWAAGDEAGEAELAAELDGLAAAGVNRFAADWTLPGKSRLLDLLDERGYTLHLHGVPDLESFLQATLLMPRSIGTDFDFPRLSRRRRPLLGRTG